MFYASKSIQESGSFPQCSHMNLLKNYQALNVLIFLDVSEQREDFLGTRHLTTE